MTQDTAMYQIR